MREVLQQLEDGLISVEDAMAELQPHVPTAIISVEPDKGVQVNLHHWEGVSMGRMEQMYHHLIQATQIYRAARLREMERTARQPDDKRA